MGGNACIRPFGAAWQAASGQSRPQAEGGGEACRAADGHGGGRRGTTAATSTAARTVPAAATAAAAAPSRTPSARATRWNERRPRPLVPPPAARPRWRLRQRWRCRRCCCQRWQRRPLRDVEQATRPRRAGNYGAAQRRALPWPASTRHLRIIWVQFGGEPVGPQKESRCRPVRRAAGAPCPFQTDVQRGARPVATRPQGPWNALFAFTHCK